MMPLRKAGANWVDGDRFFNGEVELEMLVERARDGFHTILPRDAWLHPLNLLVGKYASPVCETCLLRREMISEKFIPPAKNKYKWLASMIMRVVLLPEASDTAVSV